MKRRRLTFSTVVKGSTKALIMTTDNLEDFTVNAYRTKDDLAAGMDLTEFMANLQVKKNKSTSAWEHSGTFYGQLRIKFIFLQLHQRKHLKELKVILHSLIQ